VTDLYADTTATLTGKEEATVAVINNTTGATLLSCVVNATTKNNCSTPSGSGSAAAGSNIEVKVTLVNTGITLITKVWRATFRY
jgi:hypothetical protein